MHTERSSPDVNLIVNQYRSVAGTLDSMFKEMGLRSEVELWRVDGVGTCRGLTKRSSENWIVGPAKDALIELREERNTKYPGKSSSLADCPYHRIESGCVLGDLKSPYCISHVDYPSSLKKFLHINGYYLSCDIRDILGIVLTQKQKLVDEFIPESPVSIADFSKLALGAIAEMTSIVRRHHVLDGEERKFLNWVLSHSTQQERKKCAFLLEQMSEYSAHEFYKRTKRGANIFNLALRNMGLED